MLCCNPTVIALTISRNLVIESSRFRGREAWLSVPLTQQPLAILPAPAEYLVGVYSVRQRHPRNRCARLQSLFDDPALLSHRPSSSLRLSLNDCSLQSVHLF